MTTLKRRIQSRINARDKYRRGDRGNLSLFMIVDGKKDYCPVHIEPEEIAAHVLELITEYMDTHTQQLRDIYLNLESAVYDLLTVAISQAVVLFPVSGRIEALGFDHTETKHDNIRLIIITDRVPVCVNFERPQANPGKLVGKLSEVGGLRVH